MRRVLIASLAFAICALADTGVLIPGDRQQPDSRLSSLSTNMALEIRIDNGDRARSRAANLLGNHSAKLVKEGVYQFALPNKAVVSSISPSGTTSPGYRASFWSGAAREKSTRRPKPKPSIQGFCKWANAPVMRPAPPASSSQRASCPFRASAPNGSRWSISILVAVEGYRSEFVVPLKPDVYGVQTAGHLTILLELRSAHAIQDFEAIAKTYPLQIRERTPHVVRAEFFGSNVNLKEDFSARYSLDPAEADTVRVLTERETASGPGFFQAQALLRIQPGATPQRPAQPARTLILLFDNSLSMQWDKLERSFAACESALRRLRPTDSFNLLLFNSELKLLAPQPRPATPENVEQALAFIRSSRIRGGTDLQRALTAALGQTATSEPYLMLISDGGATEGAVNTGKLAAWYASEWSKRAPALRPHTLVFGVGDDANLPLLENACQSQRLLRLGPIHGAHRLQAQRLSG